MSNTFTTLNTGTGGDDMDEEAVTYAGTPTTRKRPRVVLGGAAADGADVVLPLNAPPAGSEYALLTRNMPAVPTASDLVSAQIDIAAAGDNTVVAGVAGQTVRVFKIFFVVAAAVNLQFKNGAGTNFTPAMALTANGSFVLDFDSQPWFVTSAGLGFLVNLSAAVQVSGMVLYTRS